MEIREELMNRGPYVEELENDERDDGYSYGFFEKWVLSFLG